MEGGPVSSVFSFASDNINRKLVLTCPSLRIGGISNSYFVQVYLDGPARQILGGKSENIKADRHVASNSRLLFTPAASSR